MGNWSHTKVLRLSKGFRGRAKNCYSLAIIRLHKSFQQAYRGRKLKKRTFRRDWILKVKAALLDHSLKYSQFIHGLNTYSNILLNRKILADLALTEPYSFKAVVEEVAEQAGVPRIPPPPVSFADAKAQNEIVDKIPDHEVKEPEFKPLRIRPGITDLSGDYLRLSHQEEDEKWRAEKRKRMLTRAEMKKLPKKPTPSKKTTIIEEPKDAAAGKGGDKGKGKDPGAAAGKDNKK